MAVPSEFHGVRWFDCCPLNGGGRGRRDRWVSVVDELVGTADQDGEEAGTEREPADGSVRFNGRRFVPAAGIASVSSLVLGCVGCSGRDARRRETRREHDAEQ